MKYSILLFLSKKLFMKDYFKVALVAKSGAGKTYSLRNLDPETTGFINMENKPLPFINNFAYYCTPKNYQEAYQKLIEYGQNEKITTIVLDTLSAYQDDVLIQASKTYKNYEIWNNYNMVLRETFKKIKETSKDIIVTAHYQIVQIDNGASSEKRIGVKGNEHNVTGVEAHFTMVMFGDVKFIDGKREFVFKLLTSGNDTAKTPPYILDILGAEEIPNDARVVIDAIKTAQIKA